MSKAIQKFTICCTDPKDLVNLLLEYGAKGAWLPEDEYPHLNHYPKHVKLAIEVIDGVNLVERDKNVLSFEPVYDVKSFTKEELKEMSWEDFRKVMSSVGLIGRDRTLMMNKYIALVGEPSDEVVEVALTLEKPKKAVKPKVEPAKKEQTTEVLQEDETVVNEQATRLVIESFA